jgi:ketopantoate reductase
MIVIGAGRVGTAIARRSRDAGLSCTLVTHTEGWEALAGAPGDPIVVAVRNDDLEDMIPRVPAHRRPDLVFVQNGMIRPWLRKHGLGPVTRGLLYVAVPERDGALTPGGDSPFCGSHGLGMARWFVHIGIPAREVDWALFSGLEAEKLVWIAVFGLLCERFDADVGTIVREHRDLVDGLCRELGPVLRAGIGVDVPPDRLAQRICAYSLAIGRYRGGVKDWPWRNGWIDATAARMRLPTPLHRELLEHVGYGDRLVE